MLFRNAKLSAVDTAYDPLQRIVGGVVLAMLMLLLYLILKALLGISATGREAAMRPVQPDEIGPVQLPAEPGEAVTPLTAAIDPRYPMIDKFVFLDLKAKFIDELPEAATGTDEQAAESIDEPAASDGGRLWVVQVASFQARERADRLVETLEEKNFKAEIDEQIIRNKQWYVVTLLPEKDRRTADEARQRLRRDFHKLRLRPIILER